MLNDPGLFFPKSRRRRRHQLTRTEERVRRRRLVVAIVAVLLLILIMMMICDTAAGSTPAAAGGGGIDELLAAIRQVESGGDDGAVGDGGRAQGAYQIHQAYYIDAAEQLRREGQDLPAGGYLVHVRHEPTARRLVLAYWRRYASASLAAGQLEHLARIHNGGPQGHRRTATLGYWRRVREVMGS